MNKKQLLQVKNFCKPFYKKAGVYHDWRHIEAVWRNAKMLAKQFKKMDMEILEAACYVHDIGRSVKDEGHPVESARLARPFLKKIGIVDEEIEAICHAVISHDKDKILQAKLVEARLLFDADKLEILSVCGFMRCWFWLREERQMSMEGALDFLWKWVTDCRKKYLQTRVAKDIADKELKVIGEMRERFEGWGRGSH